ncbi:MAG: hypothetical protein F4Y01_06335 [Gammaproteobacteria bacterium]|nr:hypothetical protein [Gammaproteobacteria bacterium]
MGAFNTGDHKGRPYGTSRIRRRISAPSDLSELEPRGCGWHDGRRTWHAERNVGTYRKRQAEGKDQMVKGVQFLVDDEGKRKGVLIDLHLHRELWEGFFDAALAKDRQDEPRESLPEVRRKVLGQ